VRESLGAFWYRGLGHPLRFVAAGCVFCLIAGSGTLEAATIKKKNNTQNLNKAGSWTSGVPGAGDIAQWDSTVTGANTAAIGGNLSWLGILITNPGGLVTINGTTGRTLTLGTSGINMSAATQNLTLNCALILGGSQIWDVTSNRLISATGVIGGGGTLSKNGLGTISLTGVNTYTGGTVINGGVVQINSSSSLGATTGSVTINAGTLELLTANNVSSVRNYQLGSSASTIQVDAGSTLTLSGTISNGAAPGSLNKTGAGTLILSNGGANTYGGAGQTTSISGGILQVGNDNLLGNSANTITFNGGTLLFSAGFTSARNVSMTGAGTINTSNNAATLSGVISGSGAFTKTGAGTLTLSGTNTYSGGITITGGNNSIISISSASNLGSGSVAINGGSVLMSTANVTLTNGIVLGAQGGGNQGDGNPVSGMLNVATGTTLTLSTNGISEATSGTGRLEKLGGGTLWINTANTYSGGTYVHDGSLVLANPTALGIPSGSNTLTVDNGAHMILATSGVFNFTMYVGNGGAGIGAINSGFTVFDNGVISNVSGQSGGFNLESGTQGAGGANTFSGSVTVNSGAALSISRDVNLGAAANQLYLNNNATLKIEDGVNLVTNSPVQATFSTSRQITLVSGQVTFEIDNTYNATNPLPSALGAHTNVLTLNGLITGSGGLIKNGLGTLVLGNAANNYSGGNTINSGILSIADPAALGGSFSSLTINPGGIFQASGSFTDARLVTLGGTGGANSGGTFDVTSGVTEGRTGVISGSGSLTKTGSGTLQLSATNTYTGDTFIYGGTIITTTNQSLGPQPTLGSSLYAVHLANGTTWQNSVSSTGTNRQVELVSGTATLNIGVGFSDQRDGLIYGAGGMIKSGGGTTILTNANTYSGGTTINAGTLQINNTSGSGTGTGVVTVNNGGILSGLPTATGFTTPGSISGTVTVNSGGALSLRSGGTFTFGGLVLNTSASSNFSLGSLTTVPLLNITGTNGFTLAGLSTINITNFAGGLAAGTYHLIDYTGTALANLNNIQLGSTPGGAFTYSLSNNQTNTSIDLIVSTSSVQWGNDANGNWGSTTNWTNSIAPNSVGAPANFLGIINSPRTVTVNGAYTAGTLTFNNTNSYTIATDGVTGHGITLSNNGLADINVIAGSHAISAPLTLTDNLQISAASGTALTISGAITENTVGRGLLLTSPGTITLSGTTANTFTGLTDVNSGTLNLGKTAGVNAIGTGGVQVDSGAILTLLASNQIADTASVEINGTFALGTFSETIGSLNGTGNVTVGSGSVLTIGSSNNLDSDFFGVISGPGTITKAGSGDLDLMNANTFGGAGQTITLQAGNLDVFADSSLGNSANSLTFTGGTLVFDGSFSSARNVILSSNGIFDTNDNSATFSGVFSGSGGLTKTGAGTLTLTGTNTYTGGTTITSGNGSVVSIGSATNLGSGALTISAGGMLMTTANFTFTNGIVLGAQGGGNQPDGNLVSGMINVAAGTTLTLSTNGISEATSGTGRLEKLGGGTLFIMASNSYSGGTYIHDGSVVLADPLALGTPGAGNTLTIDNGSQLILGASGASNLSAYIGNGGAVVGTFNPASVGFDNGLLSNVSGQSGGFTLGGGTIGLGGANTFTGNVLINDGSALSISRDANLGATSNQLFLGSNSTLIIQDGVNVISNTSVQATFATSRQINLTGGQATIEVDSTYNAINPLPTSLGAHTNTLTLNGLITGSGGLVKTGDGILVLTNLGNNYTGGTTINSGTLSIANGASLNDAMYGLTINAGATFQLTGTFTTARATTLNGSGGPLSGGTIEVTSTNSHTQGGVISGTGSLTKTGTGTLSLFGVNTYTGGTYINAGTVAVNNANSLGATSGSLTLGPATLEAVNDITSTRNIVVGNSTSTMQVDPGATYSLSGVLSGNGTLNKNGDGVLVLAGTNTYTGGTTINGGTVVVNSAASLGNGGPLVLNAATLEISSGYTTSRNITLGDAASTVQIDPSQSYTLTGVVSGTGSLTKNGTGTLTLTGANTFTGDTTVNYGTLMLSGSSGAALATTASITVNDSGTVMLGASNQISNTAPITLNGGTIAKGNFSEGTASAVGLGALTLAGPGSNIDFGTGTVGILTFASFIPGVDTLAVDNWTGTINTVGNGATDRLIFNADQSANLASFTFTGYTGAMEISLGNGFWEVVPTGIAPVPEPSTWCAAALGSLAVAGTILRRKARRKNPAGL
jgi:autotransporter-associated beta strand protein